MQDERQQQQHVIHIFFIPKIKNKSVQHRHGIHSRSVGCSLHYCHIFTSSALVSCAHKNFIIYYYLEISARNAH